MNELPWALDVIKALGVAGGPVFAVLWWLERKERQESQKTTKDLLIQTLTVTSQATNSVTAVRDAVAELREGTKDSTSALSQLIRSIKRAGS